MAYKTGSNMGISVESITPYIEGLSERQKEELLYQLLKKNQTMIEQLYFKHVSTPDRLDTRYADFKSQIKLVLNKSYRIRADELEAAKAISEAKKVINQFTKIDKRPEKEVELLMTILRYIFDQPENSASFGTCWTKYDLVVTQTLKRVITIIQSKLHEDYLLDYKPKIDKYLIRIKSASSFNDFVYGLPAEL